MKKLHIEFDLIATDKTANELMESFESCVKDNLCDALNAIDECEYIENLKIK